MTYREASFFLLGVLTGVVGASIVIAAMLLVRGVVG